MWTQEGNITQTNLKKFIVIDYFQLKFLSSLRNNYDTLFVYCFLSIVKIGVYEKDYNLHMFDYFSGI